MSALLFLTLVKRVKASEKLPPIPRALQRACSWGFGFLLVRKKQDRAISVSFHQVLALVTVPGVVLQSAHACQARGTSIWPALPYQAINAHKMLEREHGKLLLRRHHSFSGTFCLYRINAVGPSPQKLLCLPVAQRPFPSKSRALVPGRADKHTSRQVYISDVAFTLSLE